MDSSRRRRNRVPLTLIWLGLALVGFGFWTLSEQLDAYRVEFSATGNECEGNALTLGEHSGEPLLCNFQETGTRQFTDEERSRLVTLAVTLGQDGLSDTDRAQVRALNEQIAATHGSPGISDDRVLSAGHFAAVAGFPLAFLSFLWWLERKGRH